LTDIKIVIEGEFISRDFANSRKQNIHYIHLLRHNNLK